MNRQCFATTAATPAAAGAVASPSRKSPGYERQTVDRQYNQGP
ncbi:hypothetical protein [Pontiella sp.]